MIVETIDLFAEALESGTYGVNAQLDTLERETGDPSPARIKAVLSSLRSDDVARGEAGPHWPVLVLTVEEPAEAEGEVATVYRDARRFPVTVRYVSREPDTAQGVRDGLYTMRAILRTLAKWSQDDPDGATRKRRGIVVVSTNSVLFGEAREDPAADGAAVTAKLVADLYVRDCIP